jgi:hypothetical protein
MQYVMLVIVDAQTFRFIAGDLAYRFAHGKRHPRKLDPDWRP